MVAFNFTKTKNSVKAQHNRKATGYNIIYLFFKFAS